MAKPRKVRVSVVDVDTGNTVCVFNSELPNGFTANLSRATRLLASELDAYLGATKGFTRDDPVEDDSHNGKPAIAYHL